MGIEKLYIAKHRNNYGSGKTIKAAKAALVDEMGEDLDFEEITFFEAKKIKVKMEITIEDEEDEKDIVSSH